MNIQTLKEASDCLLNLAKPETQTIEHILLQDAFERIIAEDITAKNFRCLLFPKCAYDGYALSSRLTQPLLHRNIPVTLDVTEVIPAGSVPIYPITRRKSCTDHDRRTGSGTVPMPLSCMSALPLLRIQLH